ncbi:MAG: DUF86 domain-containing protein [Candidatus Omnitrophica bacterium]|nr:DUF86 domain-containing protein [Candidatus Omnitrophota bacterium]
MPSDDRSSVVDIITAIEQIAEFVGNMSKEEFLDDYKTQAAVLHELMIIGEAAKRLSEGFRRDHKSVPWKMIAGMRDKLIHEYDAADIEEVWNTLKQDLPALQDYLKRLVSRKEDI